MLRTGSTTKKWCLRGRDEPVGANRGMLLYSKQAMVQTRAMACLQGEGC